jgi:hypothetical protein
MYIILVFYNILYKSTLKYKNYTAMKICLNFCTLQHVIFQRNVSPIFLFPKKLRYQN